MTVSARSPTTALRATVIVVAVGAAYFGAAKLGLAFATTVPQVSPFWPAAGLGLAAVILFGSSAALGLFVGALAANLAADEPVGVAALIALSNSAAALVARAVLARARFEPSLERLRDLVALLAVTALIPALAATSGVLLLAFGGLVPWSAFGDTWEMWWAGDVIGILVLTPVFLSWAATPALPWVGGRRFEILALLIAIVVVGHSVLTSAVVSDPAAYQTHRLVVPIVLWAALRFGPRETSLAMLIVTIEALAAAVRDDGPFATGSHAHHVTIVELFVGFIGPTALAVTAGMCQRRRAERELQAAHRDLEVRVAERTRELVQANAELRQTTDAMTAKNEELEAFVHNVSHDLRAPLHNLRGFCEELTLACGGLDEIARDPRLAPEAAARLEAIVRDDVEPSLQFVNASATRMQRLVDALAQLSRQGRSPLAREQLELGTIVATTLDVLKSPIAAAGATVTVGALPPVTGDATALERVFTNLIGNAVAYLDPARPGRIEIGAAPVVDPAGRPSGMVHIWIRDNGRGIPTRDQAKVFQVFQRFHPSAGPGEGIGLAIVKRIVERHGGRVWAVSEEGVGSVFHLTLPS